MHRVDVTKNSLSVSFPLLLFFFFFLVAIISVFRVTLFLNSNSCRAWFEGTLVKQVSPPLLIDASDY